MNVYNVYTNVMDNTIGITLYRNKYIFYRENALTV